MLLDFEEDFSLLAPLLFQNAHFGPARPLPVRSSCTSQDAKQRSHALDGLKHTIQRGVCIALSLIQARQGLIRGKPDAAAAHRRCANGLQPG